MTHRFNSKHPISGASLQDLKQFLANPSLHEEVARKVPGTNLKITQSTLTANNFVMSRESNMDVNIPDIAKRFLSGAFKVWRTEEWNIHAPSCRMQLKMNMPLEVTCNISLLESFGQVIVSSDWVVNSSILFLGGFLERHAESEIRRHNQIELDIVHKLIADRRSTLGGNRANSVNS